MAVQLREPTSGQSVDSVQVAGSCPSVDGMAGTDGPFRIQVKVVKCLALLVPVDTRGAPRL